MSVIDRVTDLVVPLLEPLGLHLYDVEQNGGTLRITVDADGGVNLDRLAQATRAISRVFDDEDPVSGSYTLEVSSPGLERRLRRPEHFAGAIGESVSIKLGPHVDGGRRIQGELVAADELTITVATDGETRELALADITKVVTVFDWGPGPKPGHPGSKKKKSKNAEGAAPTEDSEAERRAEAR